MSTGKIIIRGLACFGMAAGFIAPSCHGQGLADAVSVRGASIEGIHLYGVSAFGGFSSSAYPETGITLNSAAGLSKLGWDGTYGATATVGWLHGRERSTLSILYSGTYSGSAQYSDLNAFNQSLFVSATHEFTPKWSVSLTASGEYNTLAEYLFQASALSAAASQTSTTAPSLASAVGQFSDSQIAAMLTGTSVSGTSVTQTQGQSLLLGVRVLSYQAQAGINYQVTPRMSLHFASFTAAGENRTGNVSGVAQQSYAMPRSIGANGGVGMSYSLSPRTEITLGADGNRLNNRYQTAYSTTGTASLGRKLTEQWYFRAYGGATLTEITRNAYGTPKTRQIIWGGSLGYRTHAQYLTATYNKTGYDNSGFAVGANTQASGNWNWRRPGARWSLTAGFGEQQLRNTGFVSLSGWTATGGANVSLKGNVRLTGQFVHFRSSGTYVANYSSLSVNSIRLTVGWYPQDTTQSGAFGGAQGGAGAQGLPH